MRENSGLLTVSSVSSLLCLTASIQLSIAGEVSKTSLLVLHHNSIFSDKLALRSTLLHSAISQRQSH